jgi:hypothetical protein
MDKLHVVTAVANPIRWESRIRLYRDFEQHMLDSGVRLTVVECAYGNRPFELAGNPHINHVPVRSKTLVWNKENLLNIGFSRLPDDWKYVAWIDADVQFRKDGWPGETVHALQQYDIIQPWSDCYEPRARRRSHGSASVVLQHGGRRQADRAERILREAIPPSRICLGGNAPGPDAGGRAGRDRGPGRW